MLSLLAKLEHRRREMGLSCAAVAQRSQLSLRTVQRVLSGQEKDAGFTTVLRLAECLGLSIDVSGPAVEDMRLRQAQQKARRLVAQVQGNAALETQGVSKEMVERMEQQTVHELLAGPPRRLWAE